MCVARKFGPGVGPPGNPAGEERVSIPLPFGPGVESGPRKLDVEDGR